MLSKILILLTLTSFIVIAIIKLYICLKNKGLTSLNDEPLNNESTLPEEEYLDPAFNISYKKAESLFNTSSIEENHIMINNSIGKINAILKNFENLNSELVTISIKSYEIPAFLKNTTNVH